MASSSQSNSRFNCDDKKHNYLHTLILSHKTCSHLRRKLQQWFSKLCPSVPATASVFSRSQCSPHSVVVMLIHFHYHTPLLPVTLDQGFCLAAIACHLQRFPFSVIRGYCSHHDLYYGVLQA